jgi:hypothetical protein
LQSLNLTVKMRYSNVNQTLIFLSVLKGQWFDFSKFYTGTCFMGSNLSELSEL